MTDKDAIDILKNCLADYVIGDYCTGGHCIDENMCKYEDCPFHTAIYTVIELIEKQQKVIDEMAKYINKLDIDEDICMKNIANTELCNEEYSNCIGCIKDYFKKKVENNI